MITNEFIAHESGTDAEGRAEMYWLMWLRRAENLLGVKSMDGNQFSDGYSLDFAYASYMRCQSAQEYVDTVRANPVYIAACSCDKFDPMKEDWDNIENDLMDRG